MGEFGRGALFLIATLLYIVLVFNKSIGISSVDDLMYFFLLNVYFFIPLLMIARIDGDDWNFYKLIGDGGTSKHLDIILGGLGIVVALLVASFFDRMGSGGLISIVMELAMIVLFFLLFIQWYRINLLSLSVYIDGSMFEKLGLLISYTSVIVLYTMNAHSGLSSRLLNFIEVILIFSPILPLMIFKMLGKGGNISGDGFDGPQLLSIYVTLVFGVQVVSQISLYHFNIQIPELSHELLQSITIAMSIPNMYLLSIIVISIFNAQREQQNAVALSVLSGFYGYILYTTHLWSYLI